MNIIEKYTELYRPIAKDGDTIALKGYSLLSKAIRWADNNAEINHIEGVVYWERGRLVTIGSWHGGVRKWPVSQLIGQYPLKSNFVILRPVKYDTEAIEARIDWCNKRIGDNKGYDNRLLLLHLLNLKMKLPEKIAVKLDNPSKYVCSQFFQVGSFAMGSTTYLKDKLLTPYDCIKEIDNTWELLLNDFIK